MRRTVIAALLFAAPLGAQGRMPDSLVNTLVIPRDTPVRQVVGQMRSMTAALGVRCSYCHVGEESMSIWEYDFASDEKPAKRKARLMMEMVNAINDEHLGRLGEIGAEGLSVSCATCHRGVALPIPLDNLLLKTHAEQGFLAMVTEYEELKRRYFGRAAYDFGEGTLNAVATSLMRRGLLDDAVRAYVMNTGLFPESSLAHFQAGEAQLATADTVSALASYRRSLELDPNNPIAPMRIEEITDQ